MKPKAIFLASLKGVKTVALLTGLNLFVVFVRHLIEQKLPERHQLDFLLTNLFAGFVPLLIAYLMLVFHQKINTFVFWLGTLLWLLYYPNSPYMISDLIHEDINEDKIFNALMIFSLAMLSVYYGFMSLKIIHHLLLTRYSVFIARVFITFALLLSSLGFFMGRSVSGFSANGQKNVPNLYSRDFLFHPLATLEKVLQSLMHPQINNNPFYMMALITIIQFSLLTMMRDVRDFQQSDTILRETDTPNPLPV